MAKFDLESYETVEARLARFWAAHIDGRVLTDLIYQDERRFIIKAFVFFDRADAQPVATGYAEEIVGASPVNKVSALENCETSAIGRALANCGFQSEAGKRPSRQEMDKVQRYESEPRKPAKRGKEWSDDDKAHALAIADTVQAIGNVDELRKVWLAQADFLDVPIGADGTTVKDLINERAAQLQGGAA